MANLAGKKIMVTSGGTREYIDDVRVITNISSGALGARIAEEFYTKGARVFYLYGKGSVLPNCPSGFSETGRLMTEQFVTCNDLLESMQSLCVGLGMDAVIHSAAVSDFTFDRSIPVKLSSKDTEGFIEHMRQTIVPTPKIVQRIKEWCPNTVLISFKFTVGKSGSELQSIAQEAGKKSKSDYVVANDKTEMNKLGHHRAYIIHINSPGIYVYENKDEIAKNLTYLLEFEC